MKNTTDKGPGYGNRQGAFYRISKHVLVREGFGRAIEAKARDKARANARGSY